MMRDQLIAGIALLMLTSGCSNGATDTSPGAAITPKPSASASSSVGATPDAQDVLAEVAASSPTSVELAAMTPIQRARSLARCFRLSTVRYCLGLGFVNSDPDYARLALTRSGGGAGDTGDLSFADWVKQRTALSDERRIAVEQDELGNALAGVPKAELLAQLQAGGH